MRFTRTKALKAVRRIFRELNGFLRSFASKTDRVRSLFVSRIKPYRRCLGILLFVFGVAIFFSPLIYKKYTSSIKPPSIPSLSSSPSLGESIETGPIKIDKSSLTQQFSLADLPKRIIVPSRQIDLPIKPSRVIEGAWELSDDSASFGLGSATPGSSGNIVIFAHAKWRLFRPLRQVKKGASVYLLTSSKWYRYEVTEIKTVLPSQVEVIGSTEDETLTLFTCTGFADAKRLIVIAKRIGD